MVSGYVVFSRIAQKRGGLYMIYIYSTGGKTSIITRQDSLWELPRWQQSELMSLPLSVFGQQPKCAVVACQFFLEDIGEYRVLRPNTCGGASPGLLQPPLQATPHNIARATDAVFRSQKKVGSEYVRTRTSPEVPSTPPAIVHHRNDSSA